MKKILLIIFIIIIIFLIGNIKPNEIETKELIKEVVDEEEVKGVFISYIDYSNLKNKTKEEQQKLITEMVNNISYFGLNSLILQVRPFSDAIYKSEIYQSSRTLVQNEGDPLKLDVLEYFIKLCSKKNISVYAWINPYRIRSENDIRDISKNSYYYKWLETNNIERNKNGIYLNPASYEVLEYIKDGLVELCENYNIKGIIYDDYFYPSDTIDLENYEQTNKDVSLKDYRINNINKLLKESYETIKKINKDIEFGISPSGNIENNLDKEYLDVKQILNEDYLDLVIPQLYFGFNNETKPYIKTLEDWSLLNVKNKDFYVALSLYKSGKIDTFAKSGKNEWIDENNIIKKQILISRNEKNYKGYYIFRYEYLFEIFDNENLNKEIENLKKLIDSSE